MSPTSRVHGPRLFPTSLRLVRTDQTAIALGAEPLGFERNRAVELWKKNDLLFPTTVGTPISPRNIVRLHKTLIKTAGVPDIPFHSLRHTYASLALREGLQLRELSERLGHYDPAFTLSTYTHVLEDATGGAMTLAELTAQTAPDELSSQGTSELSTTDGETVN